MSPNTTCISNPSKDGDFSTTLGSLCQGLKTLSVKKFSLISSWNLLATTCSYFGDGSYSKLESTTKLKNIQQSPLWQQRLYLDRRGEKNLSRSDKMLKEAVQGCCKISISRNSQKWSDLEINPVMSKRLGWMTLRNPSSREFFQDSLIPK